jgi:hypothetical protein
MPIKPVSGKIESQKLNDNFSFLDSVLSEKATKGEVDSKIASVASGSPKGTYSTLSALQTSFPSGTTGIYLVTADGKWYYWNGTAWTAGGTYQSTQLADKSVTVEKVDLPYQKTYSNLAYQNGGYLTPTYSGSTATNISSLTEYYNLPAGSYLVAVDFNLSNVNLSEASFNPMLFSGSAVHYASSVGAVIPYYSSMVDKNRGFAYGIVTVPSATNYRAGLYVTNMKTTMTNTYNMSANKVYVIPMSVVDKSVVDAIDFYSNVLKNLPVLSFNEILKNKEDIEELQSNISPISPIVCYGDSMTGFTTGWVTTLKDTYSVDIINRGVGGETAGQVATRQGGLPLIAQPFTIPADTSAVSVTMNIGLKAQQSTYEGLNAVTIDGIEGILTNTTGTVNDYTFARKTAGTSKTITRPTVVMTNNMNVYRKNPMVIWIGTNGDYDGSSRTSQNLIEIIDYMLSYGECDRYIVIGLTTDVVNNIPAINQDLAKKYGRRFLDLRSYLIEYGLSDLGITPTTADNNRISANNVPSSLLSDETHLTINAQQQIVAPLVYKKLQELKMI